MSKTVSPRQARKQARRKARTIVAYQRPRRGGGLRFALVHFERR